MTTSKTRTRAAAAELVKPSRKARDKGDAIVIERREVIGRVDLGDSGQPALAVALEIVATFLDGHLAHNPNDAPRLEFVLGDHTFIIVAEPVDAQVERLLASDEAATAEPAGDRSW